jgi:hypothetical protein
MKALFEEKCHPKQMRCQQSTTWKKMQSKTKALHTISSKVSTGAGAAGVPSVISTSTFNRALISAI